MGSMARPGTQLGRASSRRSTVPAEPFWNWFPRFIRQELRPYPGRIPLVTRMVIAATVTSVLVMVFRMPSAAIAGFSLLLLPRDSPRSTLRASLLMLLFYGLASVYVLLGVMLFVGYPLTHFLWVIVTIALSFFIVKTVTNTSIGAPFAFGVLTAIPIWDRTGPTNVLVTATLWSGFSVSLGLLVAVLTEYGFSLFHLTDPLIDGLEERLRSVATFLRARSRGDDEDASSKAIASLAMVGVSRLRKLSSSGTVSGREALRSSGTISLTGRLVDICASALGSAIGANETANHKQRLGQLADRIDALVDSFRKPREENELPEIVDDNPADSPHLAELERTTHLLALELSPLSHPEPVTPATAPKTPSILVSDIFTNPAHVSYALRGCLAASTCYVLYHAIDYPELSTCLATCVITALTSVGSSRQKQLLRFAGAAIGGLIFGFGSQIFILPQLDTIVGFAVLFTVVTWIAAWIATSSPRLSYLGIQMALAYDLINLQEFSPQTNLAVARDRVLGIALGLAAMWFIFDSLGSKPAARVMREIFAENLHLLATYARLWGEDNPMSLSELRALRDQISTNFGSVNSQADAILFEIGPTRNENLELREELLSWQPRLRSIFLILVGLVQYRSEIDASQLSNSVRTAYRNFDQAVSRALLEMADAFQEGKIPKSEPQVQRACSALRDVLEQEYHPMTERARGVLALSANLSTTTDSLLTDISASPILKAKTGGREWKRALRLQ